MRAEPRLANGNNKPIGFWRALIVLTVQTLVMHGCMDGYGQTTSMQMALTSWKRQTS